MSLKNCALRRSVLLLIGLLTMSLTTFAQITVTGTVTDETGETLIGATVMVKGTSMGVNTDLTVISPLTTFLPTASLPFLMWVTNPRKWK